MTKWDAMLVNAVCALLLDVWHVPSERPLDLEMIAAALPHVSADEPRLVRLAGHASELVAHARDRSAREWRAARLGAETAIVDIMRWRVAELHGQLTGGGTT